MPVNNTPPPPLVVKEEKNWRVRFRQYLVGRLFFVAVGLILFVSTAVFWFVFWEPWRATLSGQSSLSTIAAEQRLVDAKQHLRVVQLHASQLAKISPSDTARMEEALPSTPAIPELLVELEALATDSGMISPEITFDSAPTAAPDKSPKDFFGGKPSEAAPQADYGTIGGTFTFQVTDYAQLKTILDAVQHNLRLLDITDVTFAGSGLNATVNFTSYYLK
jgi:Tfp pilus assembly protein PilO